VTKVVTDSAWRKAREWRAFGDLAIPLASLRTTSTERTDTLQVALAGDM